MTRAAWICLVHNLRICVQVLEREYKTVLAFPSKTRETELQVVHLMREVDCLLVLVESMEPSSDKEPA